MFAEKTGKYRGEQSHAVSKGPKWKSGRTAARDRQSGNCARAESIVGTCRGDRAQGDRTRRRGRYGGHSRVHGAARAADQAPAGRGGAAAARKRGRQRRSDGEHRGCGRELAKVVNVYVGALATQAFEERLSALEKGITPDVPGPAAVRDDPRV